MSRLILLLFVALLGPSLRAAQTDTHQANRLFGLTNLWSIHLTMSAANWTALEPTQQGPGQGGPGFFARDYPWSTATFEGGGQTFTNVAIRFKGNSSFNGSRNTFKRPFKLDFNRGQKGRAFLGEAEFFLNNNVNDGTQFREALAYEAYRLAGLPAPRTAFAKVYLTLSGDRTKQFLGLYTLVEAVQDDFLKAHFATKKGLLLKPEGLRSLEYLGENWNAYHRYDPKTDVKQTDARRFIALTKLIAQADDATFERELPARIDLDNFLRFVAVNAVLANYDSFIGNGHNYYFFQPDGDAKAAFIPWDLNEAFGGHPMAGSRREQAQLGVLHPQGGSNRLIERVLANANWAALYRRAIEGVLTNACEPSRMKTSAERIARVTQEAVFAESPQAKASFQRIALGQTNVAFQNQPRGGGPRGPEQPSPGEPRWNRPESQAGPDGAGRGFGPDRGVGPGQEFGPRRGFGPDRGFGPGPGGRDDMALADWITLRAQNVADELTGKRTGTLLQMRGPGAGGQRGPPPEGPRGFGG